jgi:DNA-directed RNA polymerase specialized sigma24 family protein
MIRTEETNEMEISDCTLVDKNHGVVASDRLQPDSMGDESSRTLIDDAPLCASLRHIVAGFTGNPVVQQDLMQESLIHLWRIECDRPGQTRSWYLQSCQFHVRHCLAAGRSMDSPKRAQEGKRITIDEHGSEAVLPEHHTNGELFEAVSFQDIFSTLAKHLKPREQAVLCGLAQDLAMGEIAAKFGISYPTVLKYRRKIAALTIRLGISQRFLPLKQSKQKKLSASVRTS